MEDQILRFDNIYICTRRVAVIVFRPILKIVLKTNATFLLGYFVSMGVIERMVFLWRVWMKTKKPQLSVYCQAIYIGNKLKF